MPRLRREQVRFASMLIDMPSWMATTRLREPDTGANYLDRIEEYGPRAEAHHRVPPVGAPFSVRGVDADGGSAVTAVLFAATD